MDYLEHEMQMFFGESALLSADTVFSHRAMVSDIGKDLRAKVEFINTKIASQYDALKLSIINRTMGVVDTQTFKFSDIIGKRTDMIRTSGKTTVLPNGTDTVRMPLNLSKSKERSRNTSKCTQQLTAR